MSRIWVSQAALLVRNLPTSAGDIRDVGSIPWLGRSPGEGNGTSLLRCFTQLKQLSKHTAQFQFLSIHLNLWGNDNKTEKYYQKQLLDIGIIAEFNFYKDVLLLYLDLKSTLFSRWRCWLLALVNYSVALTIRCSQLTSNQLLKA